MFFHFPGEGLQLFKTGKSSKAEMRDDIGEKDVRGEVERGRGFTQWMQDIGKCNLPRH
jgi:hypothetical protein